MQYAIEQIETATVRELLEMLRETLRELEQQPHDEDAQYQEELLRFHIAHHVDHAELEDGAYADPDELASVIREEVPS